MSADLLALQIFLYVTYSRLGLTVSCVVVPLVDVRFQQGVATTTCCPDRKLLRKFAKAFHTC
jgi:hypothetical protein